MSREWTAYHLNDIWDIVVLKEIFSQLLEQLGLRWYTCRRMAKERRKMAFTCYGFIGYNMF
ncbi:MAG: hypothetical protein JSV82_01905 [Planctomycetota bacterium]|nr:MAG: hypothetical protein JSV82_01905 [Planctomycetota bacterium]